MDNSKKRKLRSYENIKFMLDMIHRGCKGRLTFSITSNILNKICDIFLFVYFIQYMFESVEYGGSFRKLMICFTLIVLAEIAIKITVEIYNYYAGVTDPKIYQFIYVKVIKKASRMPLSSFEDPGFYDKYQKAMDEVRTNAPVIIKNFSEIIGQVLGIMVLTVLIIRNDPVVLIFAIIPVIIVTILNGAMSKVFYRRKNTLVKEQRKADYCKRIFYEKRYANEVRIYPIRHMFLDIHKKAYLNMKKLLWSFFGKIIGIEISYKLLIHITIFVASSIYITYQIVINHRMSAGAYASLLVAVYQLGSAVRNLMACYTELINNGRFAQNLIDFLEKEPEKEPEGLRISEPFQSLSFQNVSYSYFGTNKKALDQIEFSIAKGEKLALVGYNGAGKTTLVKLLMGLYPATEGDIYYNTHPVNELDQAAYRNHFSVIFQDYQLYALSVSMNILMRKPESEEDTQLVREALRQVGMLQKIEGLKNGIETCLTHEFDENGLLLSGGESQKLAIARVFARQDADIIILDEPSSALDPISEFDIYQRIMELKGKTIIFISHRLSTARMADRILMFEKGRIIEQGTHDELMHQNKEYARMFRVQALKYTDDFETDSVAEQEDIEYCGYQ